ncbi:MAG: Rpp14/Pop5 family protein [Halobacteriaceae archaeon]
MQHLPKHLRPRWRYIAIRLESWPNITIEKEDFQRNLWYAGQNLLGDPSSADARLEVVMFTYQNGLGEAIIKVRHQHTQEARAAISCISNIDGKPVGILVKGISGTVRACEEKYMHEPQIQYNEERVAFANHTRRALIYDDRVDIDIDGDFTGATKIDVE